MSADPASPDGNVGPSEAVEALLQRAMAHAEDGEWEEMAGLLRDALEDHAGDPYVLSWLGMAERELGMEGIAYERFKQALAAEPRDPVLLATAGSALAAFDDPAAEAALRTAAMIAPELPQARWRYGAYLAREGMVEEGRRELEAAVELDPDDSVIHLELGVAHALGGLAV
jgi:tetratricopeptide (TPR) repeat protein